MAKPSFKAGNSTNYYIGVWYEKIATGTVVWVANWNRPLTSTSGDLTLSLQGVLILRKCHMVIDELINTVKHSTMMIPTWNLAEPIDPRRMKKLWAGGALLLFGEVITAAEREEITRRGRPTVRSSINVYKLERSTVNCFLPPVSVFLREDHVDGRNRRKKGGSDARS
ncbi:hypothetical protein L2E82_47116 [Cichorium intybus]|uniref:Uncharacterized protein n=1 Tax=Cichorium intybus TaxID=13427 RepID=A0ACB8YUM7_CICIN|nr:hypothetical protein L2E82_47116 [Cichorium intybus]